MWNLEVPKRIFFYWGSKNLSFLRYMTIHSFKKLNPDWEVWFYAPLLLNTKQKWGDKQVENIKNIIDYQQCVSSHLGVNTIFFDFDELGLSNDLNEVHKSDFLRYHLLSRFGGVWSDMDVLFIKPMNQLFENIHNIQSPSYYHYTGNGHWKHGIGFLMATQGSQYYTDVFNAAKKYFIDDDYQSAGASLLNNHFGLDVIKKKYPDAVSIDVNDVYSINHDSREFLYNKTNTHMLAEHSVGIHWYGGSQYVKPIIVSVNHENFKKVGGKGTVMYMIREIFGNDFNDW